MSDETGFSVPWYDHSTEREYMYMYSKSPQEIQLRSFHVFFNLIFNTISITSSEIVLQYKTNVNKNESEFVHITDRQERHNKYSKSRVFCGVEIFTNILNFSVHYISVKISTKIVNALLINTAYREYSRTSTFFVFSTRRQHCEN